MFQPMKYFQKCNTTGQGILVIYHYNLDIKLIKFVSYFFLRSDRKKELEIVVGPLYYEA
jgi:hypothetical protein